MNILRVKDSQGNWIDIPAIVGPKGDTGATGAKGDKGDRGDTVIIASRYEDLTFPVTAGTYCLYADKPYVAKTDIATSEAWTAAHWDAVSFEDEISDLKSALTGMTTATAEDEGKALKAKTVSGGKVTEWEFGETGGGSGLSSDVKAALLACFEHVAWIDEDGQDYYDALNAALNPPASLTSIDAVYTQSGNVYSGASLDTLKTDLVVTAHYDGGGSEVLSPSAYTLSGTLAAGTSIVTVTFGGKTDTFSVQVTGSSGMDGWTDGVAYRNLEIVQNEYCKASDGTFVSFNGWDRTGYVPCNGAGSITFPPYTGAANVSSCGSNRFYDQNHNAITGQLVLSLTETKTITVPSGAYYFVLSCESAPLAACINTGIIPHEAGV